MAALFCMKKLYLLNTVHTALQYLSIRTVPAVISTLLDISALDILGLDILGLDILGLDILGMTPANVRRRPSYRNFTPRCPRWQTALLGQRSNKSVDEKSIYAQKKIYSACKTRHAALQHA